MKLGQPAPKVQEKIVVEPWRVFTVNHEQNHAFTVAELTKLIQANDVPDDATVDSAYTLYSMGSDTPYHLNIQWKRPANG